MKQQRRKKIKSAKKFRAQKSGTQFKEEMSRTQKYSPLKKSFEEVCMLVQSLDEEEGDLQQRKRKAQKIQAWATSLNEGVSSEEGGKEFKVFTHDAKAHDKG